MIFLKKCMLNFIKTLQNLIPEHTFFTIFKNMYVKYMFLQLYQDTTSKVSHTFSQLKPILYVLFIKPS